MIPGQSTRGGAAVAGTVFGAPATAKRLEDPPIDRMCYVNKGAEAGANANEGNNNMPCLAPRTSRLVGRSSVSVMPNCMSQKPENYP